MSRAILAPIDANRRNGCELSPFLRGSIQTWTAVGLTREEIAKKTFLTPSTVKSTSNEISSETTYCGVLMLGVNFVGAALTF
jgi:hypothetical protein